MKKKIGLLVGLAFLPMTSFAMTSDTCFELEGGRIIDYHAERGACGLEVVIPAQINEDEVSEIAEKAFSHKGIRSVVLPSTISFIGEEAFSHNQLQSVMVEGAGTLSEMSQKINCGGNIVYYSECVQGGGNIISIAAGAFNNNQLPTNQAFFYEIIGFDKQNAARKLVSYGGAKKDIQIPADTPVIGSSAFEGIGILSVKFPEGVRMIEQAAFKSNQLTSVELPQSLWDIYHEAFVDNPGMAQYGEKVVVPNFKGDPKLISPDSGLILGNAGLNPKPLKEKKSDQQSCFDFSFIVGMNGYGIRDYQRAKLPPNWNKTSSLSKNTQSSCSTQLRIPLQLPVMMQGGKPELKPVSVLDRFAFFGAGLTEVAMEKPIIILGGALNNNQLSDQQAFWYGRDFFKKKEDKTTLMSYAGARREQVSIPEQVGRIGNLAFYGTDVSFVTFPKGLKEIGSLAFRYTRLGRVVLPRSLEHIHAFAFQEAGITDLKFPDSRFHLGIGAFNGNKLPDDQAFIYARNPDGTEDKTKVVSYGGAKKKKIVIPEGVETIGAFAFAGSEVQSIRLPRSLKKIEKGAFLFDISKITQWLQSKLLQEQIEQEQKNVAEQEDWLEEIPEELLEQDPEHEPLVELEDAKQLENLDIDKSVKIKVVESLETENGLDQEVIGNLKQALDKLKITNSLLIALYHDYLTEYQNAPEVLRSLQKALLSIAKSSYSLEQKEAYLYAFLRGITTMPTIQEAMLDRGITRAEMAKMMSVYAQTVLKKQIIRDYPAIYTDVHGMQGDLPSYINLAYQLQLMGIEADGTPLTYFLPYGEVSRAEFGTVLSRSLYGARYNQSGKKWYAKHLDALKKAGILTNISPRMKELRGWVMLMLMRSEGVK